MGWALFWMLVGSFQALGSALGVFLTTTQRLISTSSTHWAKNIGYVPNLWTNPKRKEKYIGHVPILVKRLTQEKKHNPNSNPKVAQAHP